MSELTGKSSLSDEEIQARSEDVDVFNDIKTGLEEAIAYEKGTVKEGTVVRKRSMPEKAPTTELTEDEKIDIAAAQILERFRPAFEELAK